MLPTASACLQPRAHVAMKHCAGCILIMLLLLLHGGQRLAQPYVGSWLVCRPCRPHTHASPDTSLARKRLGKRLNQQLQVGLDKGASIQGFTQTQVRVNRAPLQAPLKAVAGSLEVRMAYFEIPIYCICRHRCAREGQHGLRLINGAWWNVYQCHCQASLNTCLCQMCLDKAL